MSDSDEIYEGLTGLELETLAAELLSELRAEGRSGENAAPADERGETEIGITPSGGLEWARETLAGFGVPLGELQRLFGADGLQGAPLSRGTVAEPDFADAGGFSGGGYPRREPTVSAPDEGVELRRLSEELRRDNRRYDHGFELY